MIKRSKNMVEYHDDTELSKEMILHMLGAVMVTLGHRELTLRVEDLEFYYTQAHGGLLIRVHDDSSIRLEVLSHEKAGQLIDEKRGVNRG